MIFRTCLKCHEIRSDVLGADKRFGVPRPCFPVRLLPCKVPSRGRFRSDNHAAVLRLQKTQPKDRRAYNAPSRNPCRAAAAQGSRAGGRQTFYLHPDVNFRLTVREESSTILQDQVFI